MTTPLPEIDTEQVAAFWQRAIEVGLAYTDDMPTVFERFDVPYTEP
jgi:hypothetical protein